MQTLLEQRQRQETTAQQGLASAEAAYARAEQLLDELREVQGALLAELTSRRSKAFDPLETRTYQEYLQTISQSIHEQEGYLESIALERDSRRLETAKATQARKALDSIQERDKRAFANLTLRLEQKVTDEIAIARFNRHQNEAKYG